MATPQLIEMLTMLLRSPRGVFSVTLAIGSFCALVYILLIRSTSAAKPKAKRSTTAFSKQSSPGKASSPSKSSKSASSPKKATSGSAKKETASKSPTASKVKTSTDRKSDGKASNATKATTKTRQSERVSGSQKSDDGEWITVNKKKPRVSKKSASPEQPTAPQTRSSTRRSTQASRQT